MLTLGVAAGLLSACQPVPSILSPRGPAATQIANLGWFLLVVGGVIWLAVMLLLAVGLWRRRAPAPAADLAPPRPPAARPNRSSRWIVWGGLVMPLVVLTSTYALTLGTLRGIAAQPAGSLVIEVIGHQWWWEVRYPHYNFTTANEIHIPAGQPVTLQLTSADVIHSFWVPELHGKLDLNPGTTNALVIQADSPGTYLGRCAEFCGIQHANMAMLVTAEEPAAFEAWLTNQQAEAAPPADELTQAGQQVFLNSACVYCHTIRGTNASGFLGPDLTHLASRQALAANTVANTRGHLAGWIIDPQGIKPGSTMPPTDLSAEELLALLAYLETLH